jgi:hypothetical protein
MLTHRSLVLRRPTPTMSQACRKPPERNPGYKLSERAPGWYGSISPEIFPASQVAEVRFHPSIGSKTSSTGSSRSSSFVPPGRAKRGPGIPVAHPLLEGGLPPIPGHPACYFPWFNRPNRLSRAGRHAGGHAPLLTPDARAHPLIGGARGSRHAAAVPISCHTNFDISP